MVSDISVIICTHTEERWHLLVEAVASVKQQTQAPREIIVVIDHNESLWQRAQACLPGVTVVENTDVHGLSGARNSGIAVAQGQILAFLDDDAVATPDWLALLSQCYVEPRVLGSGGAIIPHWEQEKPSWFPEEFCWVVGCTYRGMPCTDAVLRNLIGANMSLRRAVFDAVGGFRSDIGRIGSRPVGCEETELCIRARQHWQQGCFCYQPAAVVFHHVSLVRVSWRYFCARCYAEGLSKALVTSSVGLRDGLASEHFYVLHVLPVAILRGLGDTLWRHDFSGLARAGAILVGLALTSMGYLVSRFSWKSRQLHRGRTVGDIAHRQAALSSPIHAHT